MGTYHLIEWTCWVYYWIMVLCVFLRSANQLHKMALNIYDWLRLDSLPLEVWCGINSVLVYPSIIPRAFNSTMSEVATCSDGETDDVARCFKESVVIVMFWSVFLVRFLGVLPLSPCVFGSFVVLSNFVSVVALVRGTLGEGGGDLRLAGMVGATDGLIDLAKPILEIDEASTDGETRTTEWDENATWDDALFDIVEIELEGAWPRDGNPSEEAVMLRCCFSTVNRSSWCLGFLLFMSSDHGIPFSMIVRELLGLSFSLFFFKIKRSIWIETHKSWYPYVMLWRSRNILRTSWNRGLAGTKLAKLNQSINQPINQ